MATNRPLPSPLPADLPEDWQDDQIVAPEGPDVGLTEQHGYNYLMQQVNDAQRAANQLQENQNQFQESFQEDLERKQDKLTGTQGQVVGFDAQGNAVTQEPGVGRSMAGQTVEPTQGETVTAGYGAEIFNDYRPRQFGSDDFPPQGNIASGSNSHAEGSGTTASGSNSHAEGSGTTASGFNSHAEGSDTVASSYCVHAEGINTTASGECSHAEGSETFASGYCAHAEGNVCQAKGTCAHAGGSHNIANAYQYVVGVNNVEFPKVSIVSGGSVFIVGGGVGSSGLSESARKNAFRVETSGKCYGSGAWNTSGADYAELFEWQDGNPNKEDRAGLFVTLDGDRIRIAAPEDDYILGIVSADPPVVGDVYDDQWAGMYLRDVFGRTIIEEQDFPADTREVPGENGEMETVEIRPAFRAPAPVVNPEYNHTEPYQPRTQRPEWGAVGLLGKLVAVDDGTCQVNGWATVGVGGVATASPERTKYRIMARLDDTHVRVMIL